MWDPEMNYVKLGCDIIWTGRMYFESRFNNGEVMYPQIPKVFGI
jgi:hypothetical protein